MEKRALILFAHGARAASWAEPFEKLRTLVQGMAGETTVSLAFLELMQPSLPDCVLAHVARGCGEVTIVPVFLGQGGHVLRDLPILVDQLRAAHPGLQVHLAPAIGEDPGVLSAIAAYCVAFTSR